MPALPLFKSGPASRPARLRLLAVAAGIAVFSAAPAAFAAASAGSQGSPAGPGEPKLIPEMGGTQILTTLITLIVFLGLVVILSKYAWGPIVSGLKAREDKIRRDIRDAEEARAQAEATLKKYQAQLATAEQSVLDLLAKASADAQQLATSIRANAQQEAEEAKERATKEIEAAKNQAVGEIYDQAATLGTTIAEKILRRNLNADDQQDLVRSSLEQLRTVNANAN